MSWNIQMSDDTQTQTLPGSKELCLKLLLPVQSMQALKTT